MLFWDKLLNTIFHFYRLSNNSTKPLKNKTHLPACICLTFYQGGGYLRGCGKYGI